MLCKVNSKPQRIQRHGNCKQGFWFKSFKNRIAFRASYSTLNGKYQICVRIRKEVVTAWPCVSSDHWTEDIEKAIQHSKHFTSYKVYCDIRQTHWCIK